MRCLLAITLLLVPSSALAQEAESSGASYEVVERYLADLELDELRAEYLESQIDTLGGNDRLSAARRLADLYARMLRDAPNNAARARLEARSSDLLESIPQVESDELRLSLARANFERSEEILERWRVRAVSETDARGAIESMEDLARVFSALGVEAHQRITRLESREERAREADLPIIESRLEDAYQRRSSAFYLAGWAQRYLAEFDGNRAAAIESRKAFGWLLNAPISEEPTLERIPESFPTLPHLARAMLCVAFTHALSGNQRLADDWYGAVASAPDVPADVRAQLPTRRLVALCAMERWDEALDVFEVTPVEDPSRVLMARLASSLAGQTLEVTPSERGAIELRDAGLAGLVAAGELGQAIEVVQSLRVDAMPTGGFVGGLVRDVILYQSLREQHTAAGGGERPTVDPSLRERYEQLARSLGDLLAGADAARYTVARPAALFVRGMCLYYASQFLAASESFQAASEPGAGTPIAADALWMSIVAIDADIARSTGDDKSQRRNQLVDRFLSEHPDDARASRLTMRRALEREDDPERSIELLLEVAPDDPSYVGARRQAARLAYGQALEATERTRAFRARRYLSIAEPLFALDRRNASEDPGAATRAVIGARRILNIALRLDPPDIARVERAFEAIESMEASGLVTTEPFQGELLFRMAEYRLVLDDVEGAEAHLEALQSVDPDLASQGDRLVWRHALRAWRRTREGDTPERSRNAERVARIGDRLIDAMGAGEEALRDDANASVYRAVAEASADLWGWDREESARARAQALYGALMEHAGASRETIEGFVAMASAGAEYEKALEAQRRLVAGLETGSRAWFGARTFQLELLARVDRERAKVAMRQHAALYPDLAPTPWGDRLRALARTLGVEVEEGR